jgi:4-hydroxy-2-oxoheptanedioate aldolase
MKMNRTREKLLAGEMVVGTHISVPCPTVAEICGLIGFDFVIIDLEHVLFDPETFASIVRAAELGGATPLFRPVKNDPELMLPYLDAGAMGVWVAGVSTAEDAQRAVDAVKYRPLGKRGLTAERAALYRLGPPLPEMIEYLNFNTIVSVSIEDQEGVNNIERICAVEGVDVVGLGPADLSASLGYPGQIDHPAVEAAIIEIVGRIRRAGKVAGMTVKSAAAVKKHYDIGIRYTWTSVSSLLSEAGRSYVRQVRNLGSQRDPVG